MTSSNTNLIPLGKTDVAISRLGLGVWAWGDKFVWDYGVDFDRSDIDRAFHRSLEAGVTFIDTAEIYGFGRSERILGELLAGDHPQTQIATKFMPFPWRLFPAQLDRALRGSLERLGKARVDLYQIHRPIPIRAQSVWLEAMADQHQAGLIRAIGVSNFDLDQTKAAIEDLGKFDLPLASNQVAYSLLDRTVEKSGLMRLCQQQGVTVIAYSPLAQGLLTGKYDADNPPTGIRGRRVNERTWRRLGPLMEALARIGHAHGDRSPAQVALNWVIAKGAVPIPGAKNEEQASDNAATLEWELTSEEVAELDRLSDFRKGD